MYEVLYRKWRPQTFSDVSGQETIVKTLKNEVKNNRFAHAYLFTGSRGTGKTSCARILAKAINCLNPKDGDPCGECEICKGIENGSLLDVVEIDAASNNGVDDIRDLRDEVNYTPVTAKYRVYIIDEVHMLSMQAFNALLKTLEEPPAHVVFILATTEVHKLSATILSRCQRFDFGRISVDAIANRLKYVGKNEDFSLDDSAAEFIAQLADGGMRDALSILDGCSSVDKNVTVETVEKTAGLLGSKSLFDLSDAIAGGDASKMFLVIDKLNSSSGDMMRVCDRVIIHFRNIMIAKTVENPKGLIICSPNDLNGYMNSAQKFSLGRILKILDTLQNSLEHIKYGRNGRVELEMALIGCFENVVETVQTPTVQTVRSKAEEPENIVQPPKNQDDEIKTAEDSAENYREKIKNLVENVSPENIEPAVEEQNNDVEIPVKEESNKDSGFPLEQPKKNNEGDYPVFPRWAEVISEVGKKNPLIRAVLNQSEAFVNGDYVLIKCSNPDFLNFMRDGTQHRSDIRNAILTVTGKPYKLGPYKQPEKKEKTDPLQAFKNNAEKNNLI